MATSWDNFRSYFKLSEPKNYPILKDMFLRKEKDERLNSFWESSQVLKSKSDYESSEQSYSEYKWKNLKEGKDKENSV